MGAWHGTPADGARGDCRVKHPPANPHIARINRWRSHFRAKPSFHAAFAQKCRCGPVETGEMTCRPGGGPAPTPAPGPGPGPAKRYDVVGRGPSCCPRVPANRGHPPPRRQRPQTRSRPAHPQPARLRRRARRCSVVGGRRRGEPRHPDRADVHRCFRRCAKAPLELDERHARGILLPLRRKRALSSASIDRRRRLARGPRQRQQHDRGHRQQRERDDHTQRGGGAVGLGGSCRAGRAGAEAADARAARGARLQARGA